MRGWKRFRALAGMGALSVAVLWWWYPDQVGVVVVKLNAITLGALLGFVVDREVFPYARPGRLLEQSDELSPLQAANRVTAFGAACIRRAIIVGLAMLAMALAL